MVTNNVRDLPTGRGVYGFVLTPQGRIVADLYAYNRGDSLLVDTDQGQIGKLLETFDHYIIMDDVEVTNVSDKLTAIGIAGPDARETLRRAGFEFNALEPSQFLDVSREQVGVTIVRTDLPTAEPYEIWLTPAHAPSLCEASLQARAPPVPAA